MRITIDIRDDIHPYTALELVQEVIKGGRVSDNGKMYCYATIFNTTYYGDICVRTREYRKSDCFIVCKSNSNITELK